MNNVIYNIHEAIGNYSEVVFRADSWYEVHEYLENRLNSSGTDPDDDAAVENFYSYFNVESIESEYDYMTAETADICEYIRENIIIDDYNDIDDLREKLYDDLWITDSVTGNGSGSYTFSRYVAERNLCGNLDLLADALEEFGCTDNAFKYIRDAETADVTIRCYLLGQCIDAALEELGIEDEFDAREAVSDIELVNA